MGWEGMAPYYFLYMIVALLLLAWLAMTVITVVIRLHQREEESRQPEGEGADG